MRDTVTVMKFTAKDMVKRKSFIISTIIILAMIVIGFNIPKIIKSIKKDAEKIIIVDKDNIFEGKIQNKDIEIITENNTLDEIKEKIQNGDVEYGIIINKEENNINLTYVLENKISNGPSEEFESYLTTLYKDIQIEKLNIDKSEKQKLAPQFNYRLEVVDENIKGNPLVMMMISIVLFYAVYFCAFQVSNSITTEKTSKIIETLVTSTSPTNIIIGKTLGVGLVGLCQLALIIITAYISAKSFIDPKMLEMALDTSALTPMLGLITLVYFLLGYLTFGLMYALTGSTVSKPEDIQSANQPVVFITIIGFYLAYFTMINPSSNLNHIAALLPISSPFCMPLRIMMGASSTNEILLSIAILIITIIVIAKVAINIYRSAILNYGKTGIKDLIKMYKQR
ncbi:MAG: ABC transporter permease [Bacilli bacterium]